MNGVLRGNTYGPAYRSRPGWRRNDYWVRVDSAIGFRLNGVNRGGSYTQYNLVYMYRSGGLRQPYVRSHPLGFRLTF